MSKSSPVIQAVSLYAGETYPPFPIEGDPSSCYLVSLTGAVSVYFLVTVGDDRPLHLQEPDTVGRLLDAVARAAGFPTVVRAIHLVKDTLDLERALSHVREPSEANWLVHGGRRGRSMVSGARLRESVRVWALSERDAALQACLRLTGPLPILPGTPEDRHEMVNWCRRLTSFTIGIPLEMAPPEMALTGGDDVPDMDAPPARRFTPGITFSDITP